MQKQTGVALAAAIILGGICAWQAFAMKGSAQKIAALEQKLRSHEAALQSARASAAALTQQKQWLDTESQTLRKKIETLAAAQPATTAPQAPSGEAAPKRGNGLKNFFAKMMNDPEMKEKMRTQTRDFLKGSHAALFKEMGLTPEQSDQLLDLLAERQMKMSESGAALLGSEGGDRQQAAKTIAEQRKAADGQIRSFLGDANFQKLDSWENGMGARMQADQFKSKLAGGATPLQDLQSQQLSAAMQEETSRATPQFTAEDVSRSQKADPTFFMETANVDRIIARQTEVNQRVLDRSRAFLNADQLKGLGEFQTQQLETQKFGLKMASKMFGDDTGGATPAR